MALVLVNAVYRLHQIKLHTAQDFACEEAGLGLDSGKYYTPESSYLRREIFNSIPEPEGCDCFTVDECVAKYLYELCPKSKLFFFPAEGLKGEKKVDLISWLSSLIKEENYKPDSLPDVKGNFKVYSFKRSLQETLPELIEFLQSHDVIYTAN